MSKSVVVVGASGVIGRAAVNHLKNAGIRVIGISRRRPDLLDIEHISLDLMDAGA